ncbi:MAG: hypothetical protein QOJ92_675 [Frankiales bacterium]|nr:hypothetical protein [Frankiales bacterium]MDX6273465.1 hypothetical protein [Frankiales bacterium]
MSRRVSLPGADELFRSTGPGLSESERSEAPAEAPVGAPTPLTVAPEPDEGAASQGPRPGVRRTPARPRSRSVDRRPSGRERHEEKITVYCSQDELIELEQARLTLRGEHGLAVDRGRIVREAVAVVIADLEAKGDASILVRRLRGD